MCSLNSITLQLDESEISLKNTNLLKFNKKNASFTYSFYTEKLFVYVLSFFAKDRGLLAFYFRTLMKI